MSRAPDEPATPPATRTVTDAGAVVRSRLPGRLVAWLEQVLGPEDPPSGLADEIWAALRDASVDEGDPRDPDGAIHTDLHAVWTAVTALTQEVKLQGRTFARLAGELQSAGSATAPAASGTMASVQHLAATLTAEREAALRQEGARQAWLESMHALLDVRDALARGLSACRGVLADGRDTSAPAPAPAPAPVSRLARAAGQALHDMGCWLDPPPGPVTGPGTGQRAREAAVALEKGCALSLDRVDELLRRHDVREIPCQGERFDPQCMGADDVEESTTVEEPMVVEVYRPGYRQGDEVLRAARVKVARPSILENP